MEVSDLKKTVLQNLRKLSEQMNKILNNLGERYGITVLQLLILFELFHHGKHTIGSLANSICVAEANLSLMCKKLEQKGFIKKIRNIDDGRVVEVILTPPGEKLVYEIDQELDLMFGERLRFLEENSQVLITLGMVLEEVTEENNIKSQQGKRRY